MELSHRDQTESSAAGGLRQLTPTTLWHFTVAPLSISLLPLKKKWVHFVQVLQLQGSEVILSNKTVIAYLPACLLHCLLLYPPLCSHARRPICGLRIGEAEFSLTVLWRDVHSAIPVPCTQSHHSALTPGCCLAVSHWTAIPDCFQSWGSADLKLAEGREARVK